MEELYLREARERDAFEKRQREDYEKMWRERFDQVSAETSTRIMMLNAQCEILQSSISDALMEGSMTKMTFAEAIKEFVVNNNDYGYTKLNQIIPFLHAKVKAACQVSSDPLREHQRRVCCNLNDNNKRRYNPVDYSQNAEMKRHCSESVVAPC
eukprot:TRINITY_DN993_c0_g1_i3.p1 TRINITY_DN993_c0_g1~~TRINITY_DN993_c0_g1_i3.p1  ORF type:complete len:166 (+),score=36.37 TRINITY_DN993_c0_g1_i3:38-499(+)